MYVFLIIIAAVSWLFGLYAFLHAFLSSESAIHEILSVVSYVAGNVALVGAVIIKRLDALHRVMSTQVRISHAMAAATPAPANLPKSAQNAIEDATDKLAELMRRGEL